MGNQIILHAQIFIISNDAMITNSFNNIITASDLSIQSIAKTSTNFVEYIGDRIQTVETINIPTILNSTNHLYGLLFSTKYLTTIRMVILFLFSLFTVIFTSNNLKKATCF
jgi:hypothetical protein